MNAIITLLCNVPDKACANNIAQALLENHLVACINIFPEVTSLYRWQEKIEKKVEIPLLIKTTAACFTAVQQKICALHLYTVPELLVFTVTDGVPAYLQWIVENVSLVVKDAVCETD